MLLSQTKIPFAISKIVLDPIILEPLTNICDSHGLLSDGVEKDRSSPPAKKKDASEVSDFRPISILSGASKLLEFVALRRSYTYRPFWLKLPKKKMIKNIIMIK